VIEQVALLINPGSDRGRGLRVGVEAAREFRRLGTTVDVLIGSDVSESAALAGAAVDRGCGALVVCGGDGIVHTALQAVAGSPVPLGVVPAGSGNDFARDLGIPRTPTEALMALVGAVPRCVDLVRVSPGGARYCCVASVGLDELALHGYAQRHVLA